MSRFIRKPLYEDYSKLIARIAWSFVCCYGFEIDELMSEGYITFDRCTERWDVNQGCFSTYLYTSVTGRFNRMLTARVKDHRFKTESTEPCKDYATTDGQPTPEWTTVFISSLQELSTDAQFLVKVIWDTPTELYTWIIEEKTRPMITIKLLKRYLNKIKLWPYSRIERCFDEIRSVL